MMTPRPLQTLRNIGGEAGDAADEIESMRGLLLWALYHAQGGGSPVGQPIRRALGIGQHDHMTAAQINAGSAAASDAMRHNVGAKRPPKAVRLSDQLGGCNEEHTDG